MNLPRIASWATTHTPAQAFAEARKIVDNKVEGPRSEDDQMPEDELILKRNPGAESSDSYNVLFEGRHVGRIYYANRPVETPWFWVSIFSNGKGATGRSTATPRV